MLLVPSVTRFVPCVLCVLFVPFVFKSVPFVPSVLFVSRSVLFVPIVSFVPFVSFFVVCVIVFGSLHCPFSPFFGFLPRVTETPQIYVRSTK